MSIKIIKDAVASAKSTLWDSGYEGYGGLGTIAPMVAESSDEESADEGTHWEHPAASVVVGSERGVLPNSHSSPANSNLHTPAIGEPFSALIPNMWPQDILGKLQQPEDSGMHPECEYDEFGYRMDKEETDKEDPDPCSYATSEDPSLRLKWTAYIESTQKSVVGDLTWDMVSDTLEQTEKLKELVYEGIPHSMRIHLWSRLSGALKKKKESELSYKKILKRATNDDSLISNQIEKDLCRTMPSNACFQNRDSIGITKLQNILEALAWLYPDIGYCQGMGMICASLLLYVEEEDVFWIMVAIIEDLLPSSYYTATLIGVQVDQRVLRQLIANCLPAVDDLMKEHDIELSLITLHWFLTAMSSVLKPKVLLRVWDIFFFEGSISLFKITLGMIKSKESQLLDSTNSAQIFNMLSDIPGDVTDIATLLTNAEKAASSITPVILDAHRKKHFAFLLAEAANKQDLVNNNSSGTPMQVYRRTRIPIKKNWVHLAYDFGKTVYDNNIFCGMNRKMPKAITMKAKNVLQTEMIIDLREAILLIARHFNYKGTKADLLPDYSSVSHVQDFENFVNNSSSKQRRAKALIDFERHEDDELGFRKNDLITIISQKDEHCWIGELNGLRGWFPAKFVQVLDERSKEYSSAGDDSVTETVNDLVRGRLYHALRRILEHGMINSISGKSHPWMFIEEASSREVMKDFQSVYSRLVLCKTYKLDEDGKVLTPEEILYRAVQAINATHDRVRAHMDVKLRSLIAYGLNEQILHLWFELFCSLEEITKKWYNQFSFMRSPGWIQIKCELRVLAKFSFNLSMDYEIKQSELATSNMKDDVQDMLVKHHLFSWDL